MATINPCPICGQTSTELIIERKSTPVNQCIILPSEWAAKNTEQGRLTMRRCSSCGFIFNESFDRNLVKYDEDYNNINLSSYYDIYLQLIVEKLGKSIPFGGTVAEVGCGQGLFLKKLCEYRDDITAIGYDPSYKGEEILLAGRLRFEKFFLEESKLPKSIDVVVCRHVIEHIAQPKSFLQTLFDTLSKADGSQIKVIFETPCNEWIIKNQVYWDFFYEHCSIFSAHSLWKAFQETGFFPEIVDWVFEGQYLWIESWFRPISLEKITMSADGYVPEIAPFSLVDFSESEKAWRLKWQEKIKSLRSKIGVIGAGAKGVTFVNLFDPDANTIEAVIDVSPQKHGKYIPGSGHKIIGYEEIQENAIASVILLNPNYLEENRRKLYEIDPSILLVSE